MLLLLLTRMKTEETNDRMIPEQHQIRRAAALLVPTSNVSSVLKTYLLRVLTFLLEVLQKETGESTTTLIRARPAERVLVSFFFVVANNTIMKSADIDEKTHLTFKRFARNSHI
jgi:hypothetical protein